ncbi:hypothetical protein EV426DRAFT_574986 [Tirmania nivea]|nr:hypothetical protein EV426DRAFT_574986 [Tirmania nivea]
MFIGGLNWETTDESLKNYFSQFGEVTECTVMRDGTTGRSRGFGFLTFKDPKTVNIVMVKEHYLDQKIIDPKRAIPRDEQEKTSKIFVGGVSQEATETDFREYFMQFGRVLDATLMMDKDTGRPRGFGFVTFDSEGAVENALNHPNLEIMGKAIEVKKAQPRGNPRDRNATGGHFDERDDSRGGFNRTDRRGFDRDGGAAGAPGNPGYGQQGPNGGAVVGQQGSAIYNGMSPAMMAQYWSSMQRYMAVIMQQQAAGRGKGMPGAPTPAINPMMMNPAMMNPQMMQQMQLAQQTQGQMPPNAAAMGAMGMNGMGGMGTQGMGMGGPQAPQQQQHQQGPQGPYGSPQGGPQGGYGQSGYSQQHEGGYDHSQQQQHGGHPHGNIGHSGPVDSRYQRQAKEYQSHHQRDFNPQQQGPSSWEGMYDDVPPQQGPPQHQHHQNMNNGRYPSHPHPHSSTSAQPQAHAHHSQGIRSTNNGPTQLMRPPNHNLAHNQIQHQHHQHQNQQNRMPPAGPSYNPSGTSGSTPQPTSGPPPNAPTGPRNARNPAGPAAFRGPGARGAAGPGMQGGGGMGPIRGPGGFSRGAAVGGLQQGPGGIGGHGYHPYARNSGNQSGGGGERGAY